MEAEVLDALEATGYNEVKLDESNIEKIVQDHVAFSKILAWITSEMKAVAKLEEGVKPIENQGGDLMSFHMDLSSFLKELGCTYSTITRGDIGERFNTTTQRLLVLTFLLSELQALRMLHVHNSKQRKTATKESEQAKILREICQTIGLPKPPPSTDIRSIFGKIEERLTQIQSKIKSTNISYKPIFSGSLSQKQWGEIEDINKELNQEYLLRREMLLKRLDVTIQSFHWSDKLGIKKQALVDVFREHRSNLTDKPNITISHLLAARTDILFNEKTSSGSARAHTRSALNDFLIGKVPDRGGRPDEAVPPPPEMPPWQQRSGPPGASGSVGWVNPRGGSRGGGGRGGPPGGRGAYPQHGRGGDYQQHDDRQQREYYQNQGEYGPQRGSYQQRGGSHYQQQGGYQQPFRGDYRGGGRGASRVQGGWTHY